MDSVPHCSPLPMLARWDSWLSVKERMREILSDIQSGRFAKQWVLENQAGTPSFLAMRRREAASQVEKVGAQLRALAAEGTGAPGGEKG